MPEIPFIFHCSFPENKFLTLLDSVNENLSSASVSSIPELEYHVRIYPNGNSNDRQGQTWIFLHIGFANVKKVEVDFTFRFEAANVSKNCHYIYDESIGWGIRVCKTDDFFNPEKKYIVDGKCDVKVYGVFKFDIPVGQQKWIGGELGNAIWENNDTKDFLIITKDGKEIKVHKFILGIRSEVFTAMFNSNMKEATENKVDIPEFPFNVAEVGIKLIYNCSFNTTLSLKELILLLQFLDKYQLLTLKEKIEPYLIEQISAATVSNLTNAAILTNSFKLKEKCMEFLSSAFATKTPVDNFEILDKDVVFEIVQNSFGQIVKIQ